MDTGDYRAVPTGAVVVEPQDAASLGVHSHQSERHTFADTGQIEHTTIRSQERHVVRGTKLPDGHSLVRCTVQAFQKVVLSLRCQTPPCFLLGTFLQGTGIRGKDLIILLKAFHGERVITNHAQAVQHLPQFCRMPPARSRHVVDQLVRDRPSGRQYPPDGLPRLGRDLQRRLEMRLHEKLGDARLCGFLPEISQDVQQFVVHTHRQVHRQARPQTDTL